MGKRGRPPKPPEEALSARLDIRLTQDERDQCDRAAVKARIDLSDWIRRTLSRAAKKELSAKNRRKVDV